MTADSMRLGDLMREWRPGSHEWDWADEFNDLWSRDRAAMDMLATSIREQGMKHPIHLGDDGRVWDGHHRIAAAYTLGIEVVAVAIAGCNRVLPPVC